MKLCRAGDCLKFLIITDEFLVSASQLSRDIISGFFFEVFSLPFKKMGQSMSIPPDNPGVVSGLLIT